MSPGEERPFWAIWSCPGGLGGHPFISKYSCLAHNILVFYELSRSIGAIAIALSQHACLTVELRPRAGCGQPAFWAPSGRPVHPGLLPPVGKRIWSSPGPDFRGTTGSGGGGSISARLPELPAGARQAQGGSGLRLLTASPLWSWGRLRNGALGVVQGRSCGAVSSGSEGTFISLSLHMSKSAQSLKRGLVPAIPKLL